MGDETGICQKIYNAPRVGSIIFEKTVCYKKAAVKTVTDKVIRSSGAQIALDIIPEIDNTSLRCSICNK